MRLSIEISQEQHRRLKALAAFQGKSIKDYVLEKTLLDVDRDQSFKELEAFLSARLEEVRKLQFSQKSVDNIFDEVTR